MSEAAHPLDRPIWSALTGPQANLAIVAGRARRMEPAYGLFAVAADGSPASLAELAALIATAGDAAMIEPDPPEDLPGLHAAHRAEVWQMWAPEGINGEAAPQDGDDLAEADAAEMLALARLTEPGPFFERTHQLGRFIGIKHDGRLAAMAGERMRLEGFTEVSGVCTHPDFRGRGYAAALTHRVAARIIGRGEIPFLHVYASNTGAIAVYEKLGFSLRRTLVAAFFASA